MHELPEHYRQIHSIDLMKCRPMGLLSLALLIGMLALGFVLCPKGSGTIIGFQMLLYLVLLLFGIVAYMMLHELIHGVAMQILSGGKPSYGFNGVAAYAGSAAYFTRGQYTVIALLPLALLGALLAVLNALLYPSLFWFVYILQTVNVSGAAGDVYVTLRIAAMPADTLVLDTGTRMRFYSAQ